MSSTFRELLAVKYSLQSLSASFANESIRVYVDIFSASRILTVVSAKIHLQALALKMFQICLNNNIRLLPTWVPRELNYVADYYSKLRDTDDWSIDNRSFENFNKRYGPFTIDRFAENLNTKLPNFNSKFYCPQTSAVDAFTEDWSEENNWICPHVSLIGSVFRHMQLCKAHGTILLPVWQSAYFWPFLYPNALRIASFIRHFSVIDPLLYFGRK